MTDSPAIPTFLRAFPGAVLRLSTEGIVLESNGKFEEENGVEIIGLPFEKVLDEASSGEKWRRVSAGAEDGQSVQCELVLNLAGEPRDTVTFSISRGAAGDMFVIELPADPRLGRLNEEVHTINATLNVTQRELSKEKRRLNQVLDELQNRQFELARSNRDLEQFAHVISHDLKAPLRNVRSYAEFLRQDLEGTLPEEAEGFLHRIIVRAADMEAMINGVLRYARAGQSTSPTEMVDVCDMIHELVDLHGAAANVQVSIVGNLAEVETNRTQLRQVLQNLISNAVKYGVSENPAVEITATDAGEQFEVRVADNGPGIATDEQERIWNLFYTTSATEDNESGSGIGLALVKRLVERNGGTVRLESAAGRGAAFVVCWPKVRVKTRSFTGEDD